MKPFRIIIPFLILLGAAVVSVNGAWAGSESLSPGLEVISASTNMTVSQTVGNDVSFSAKMFSDRYLLPVNTSVTVTALPAIGSGVLNVSGKSVYPGQELSPDSLSSLCFTPADGCTEASFTFTFDGSYCAQCLIRYTDKVNFAPYSEDALEAWTCSDVFCSGVLRATDPEGDAIKFELVTPPRIGIVSLSADGAYSYTPFEGAYGRDSFSYRVIDDYGNMSDVSTVSVRIDKNNFNTVLSDISDSPCGAYAIRAVSEGIMDATNNGNALCFDPSGQVSRLDFLVWSMDTFGAGNVPVIADTGFDDDADIPGEYKGYVAAAAKLGIIGSGGRFDPSGAVSYGEAAQMLNGILGLKPLTTAVVQTDTVGADDIAALCENGIISKSTDPKSTLDRCHCAEMLCLAKSHFE